MAASWRSLLSDEAVVDLVGREAFARALVLTRSGYVHGVEVDPESLTVTGRVRGTHRDDYTVTVHLASSRTGAVSAYRSQCTCPVVTDCKHAAAVLIVARHLTATDQLVERPEWEKTLDKLIAGTPGAPTSEIAPLALEFGVERIPPFRSYVGRQDLRIRPVRQGRSGGWVRSGISWDDLDFVARSYVPEHRELLMQFRAAAGASARYSLPRSAWLSLSTVSSGFWGLLDQTATVGLTVLAEKPLRGPVRSPAEASISLDVRRAESGGFSVGAEVSLDGRTLDLSAVGLIGEPAHGAFVLTRVDAETEELTVARLDQLPSRELRQLVLDARLLTVPGADEARFLETVPQLRQKVPVRSVDQSVALPNARPPTLGLTVSFRAEHRVRLDWSVCYDLDTDHRTYVLDEPFGLRTVRDAAAEQAALAALPLPYATIPELADPEVPDRPAAHVLLAGRGAFTFVEHVLPTLQTAGVEVAVTGEVLEYRETDSAPEVRVRTTPRRDSADWFDLHITVAMDGEQVPFDELFVALTQEAEFLILDTGVYFALDRPEFTALRELIEESRTLADRERPELTINRVQAGLWDDLVSLGAAIDQSAQWSRTVAGLSDQTTIEAVAVPATLRAELRPYQRDGFRWLRFLWQAGLGGILADDMGLGKTLQALALILHADPAHSGQPPFLVVAPTSVVSNWVVEAERFAPGLRVVSLAGSRARRGEAMEETIAGADVVVTSYALLRLEVARLSAQSWSGLILDEAQFVKNHRAKTYQCALRIPAPFKLAITGTPLENSLMDLWALLSVVAPGLFPHAERFSEYYRRPIERHSDAIRLAQLRRRVRPLMLRRTKESVATELPPKQEQVVEVVLHPRHQRIYQTHLQRERQKVLGLIEDLERNRFTVLRSLTLLRRLSLDPALIDEANASVPAAKTEVLVEDLRELVGEGHQALVFSQFTSFLRRIRSRLDEEGISTAYLDGRTRNRERVVDTFRSQQASVFLISLKAGGFGLNLTEADYCFVLDPWWNPATEAQAVDRTHRIGQTRTVMVYRLVAKDTIEEKVMALKARKEQLFDSVLGGDSLSSASLTADEIRGLIA